MAFEYDWAGNPIWVPDPVSEPVTALNAQAYWTTDNAGNPVFVSEQQARDELKTWLNVDNWTSQEVQDYIANTPGFYDQYRGISNRPAGYEDWEQWIYSEDFPTGTYSGWKPTEVSGGMFGTSFMDPKKLSEYVEPINKYVGPLVLPTVMAIGGAAVGGGLAAAGLAGGAMAGGTAGAATTAGSMAGMTAAGQLGVAAGAGAGQSLFGSLNQGITTGDWGGALLNTGKSIGTAVAGAGLLGQFAGTAGDSLYQPALTTDPSLSLNSGLYTPDLSAAYDAYTASQGAGSMFNTPTFTVDPTLAPSTFIPSTTLSTAAAEPVYNNVFNQPTFTADSSLAPSAPEFTANPELQAYSDSLPAYDSSYVSTQDELLSDAANRIKKGLMSGGSKSGAQALPLFGVNSTPAYQPMTSTASNVSAAPTAAASGSTFQQSPFKGSFLGAADEKTVTDYLSDYLPLSSKKKIKNFTDFLA